MGLVPDHCLPFYFEAHSRIDLNDADAYRPQYLEIRVLHQILKLLQ